MTEQKRNRIGAIFTVVLILSTALLGAYISIYEVDQRPTLRAIFNLAGAHFHAKEYDKAKVLWQVVMHYKEIYGPYQLGKKDEQMVKFADHNLNNLRMLDVMRKTIPNFDEKKLDIKTRSF